MRRADRAVKGQGSCSSSSNVQRRSSRQRSRGRGACSSLLPYRLELKEAQNQRLDAWSVLDEAGSKDET